MEKRDIRIDFLRGTALMMMFADHVPSNPLSLATLQSFAFSDAAELFFFLSGFVAAMVYGHSLDARGFVAAAARIWRRAWDIYAAQMVLLFFFVAEICAIAAALPDTGYLHYFRVEAFISQTEATVMQSLMLRFQPQYLDILPLYAVFFALLPFVLAALRRGPWLVLLGSFFLYAGTQLFGWNATTHPHGEGWYFDPFAWQFVFVIGAVLGSGQLDRYRPLLFRRPVLIGAGLVAVAAAAMQFTNSVHAMIPAFPTLFLIDVPIEKTVLEPARLVSFFALVVLAARWMPDASRLSRFGAVRALARCGRHSLAIFCMGILLAVPGHVLWMEAGQSQILQLVFNLAGMLLLIGAAWLLEWTKERARPIVALSEPERVPA
ncbi:MAG TPA: OpgC domain-containing protein [Rhizomicrobium sp.]|nr:OpgC domain-containing protein [Rhizomicrobium sp.]